MPDKQPSPRKHVCNVCDSRFSRLSHLQRHQLLHSDQPQEIFKCGICDKCFNRKDVYLRHHRGVHGATHTPRRNRRKKSCERCIRYKLKCSRELPCTTCKTRDAACRYDVDSPPQPPTPSNQTGSADTTREPVEGLEQRSEWHDGHRPAILDVIDAREQRAVGGIDSLLNAAQLNGEGLGTTRTIASLSTGQDHVQPAFALATNQSWPHERNDGLGSAAALPDLYDAPFDPTQNVADLDLIDFGLLFDGSTFQASRTDWLGAAADYSDRQTLGSIHLPSESPYDLNIRQHPEDGSVTNATPGPGHCGYGEEPPVTDQRPRNDWPHSLDVGGNESWPFDYTSNKGYRKIKLPPLRQVLEQTVGHRPVIDRATLLDLISIFGSPFIPVTNEGPAPEALPAVTFLSKLVKVYFEEFHPVINVIHMPTWKIEKCPTALLAAMACLGATYSTADGSSDVAVLLAEITQRALFWAGQEDTTSWRDPAYITAMCLHHTYSLGSGNRRLYELADAARGVMVTSLRGIGVLAEEETSDMTTNLDNLRRLSDQDLDDAWAKWRSREVKKRVAWMIFEFDCTISTMTNKRGAFNISELPSRLPCSSSLWEAHSAKAWLSMLAFSAGPICGAPFYPLMQNLSAAKADLAAVPVWGRRLCALAISRVLWDLKEMKTASAPNMFGMSSLAVGHKASSDAMLKSLSTLNESLSSPSSTAEVVNLNVTCLSAYYTDLITRTSAMDLIVFIFRNSGREQSSRLCSELAAAKEHLRSTFARNPVDTRRSLSSAANIISVARECTSFTPSEVMRLFNGWAFLLAFVRFASSQSSSGTEETARLDIPPWRRTQLESATLNSWIARGGRASFRPVDDVCRQENFDALKQDGLLAMQGLRTWGLARKFHRVLQGLT